MIQKYIEGDLVITKTEPNNFTPNGVVCKFVEYVAIDKVLIRAIDTADRFVLGKGQIAPIHLTFSVLDKMDGSIKMIFITKNTLIEIL